MSKRKPYVPNKHMFNLTLTHMRKVAYEILPEEAQRRLLKLRPNDMPTILKAKAKRDRKLERNRQLYK